MTANIADDPQKFGLKTIGQIEFSSGCYEFDTLIVWQRQDGLYVTGRDAGCSCPIPFEDVGLHNVDGPFTPHALMESLHALVAYEFRDAEEYHYGAPRDQVDAELVAIGTRVMA